MKKYVVKTPFFINYLYPKRLWHYKRTEKNIYLTFDDGPIPRVTPWVLEELKKYNAKATFFCIGKNIAENPQIFRQLYLEGHTVGNHTQNHLNGNKTPSGQYIENVIQAQQAITHHIAGKKQAGNLLFRPPYGKLSFKNARILQKQGYKIVMWDVLSGDFDQAITPEKCLNNVLKNIQSGSIVIFHDSTKAKKNLQYALPKVLTHFSKRGYSFKAIS